MTRRPTPAVGARPARVPTAGRGERGAATAETAMVLPLLVAAVVGLAWALGVAVAQVRVTDAAREVARLLARDEPPAVALARGQAIAPPGAEFEVSRGAAEVVVEVRAEVAGPGGLLRAVPGVDVDARAVAALESP